MGLWDGPEWGGSVGTRRDLLAVDRWDDVRERDTVSVTVVLVLWRLTPRGDICVCPFLEEDRVPVSKGEKERSKGLS